ncbi:MAG: glycosyltransferase family 2 protein [Clostridiales bacterium]|nr:glycosyltransferase family 2 protein [Clostridiales bacterium]
MKSIGIVICSYNKSEYVCRCIESVLQSDTEDFDIYMVDNASTDDSVEAVTQKFGDKVTILQNEENLGGSGGFNRGIRKVLEEGYKYLMCLDDDVKVTKGAVRALYEFLKKNPKVGMVGSKVYHMHAPEYVQQMGLKIHFESCSAETLYADRMDTPDIPEVVYCDTVAACSLMMPTRVVKNVGMMPEDNFIYWDDMEWGYLVGQAGYQVAAYGGSKVYHEMSANVRKENTFSTYYMWRNHLNFFMKYTKREQWEKMSFYQLRSVFDAFYESMYREEHNVAKTIMSAFLDAMMLVRGKASPDKILVNDGNQKKVNQLLDGLHKVYVEDKEQFGLKDVLKKMGQNISFVEKEEAEKKLRTCRYIMEVTDFSMEYVYIDQYWNILLDEGDVEAVRNYGYSLQLFIYMHQNTFLSQMEKLRAEERP